MNSRDAYALIRQLEALRLELRALRIQQLQDATARNNEAWKELTTVADEADEAALEAVNCAQLAREEAAS